MNVYIDQVDDGLGSADVWDTFLAPVGPNGGPRGAQSESRTVESPIDTGLS